MTSGPDPGELPGFWGSMVFRHAPIPRKGSGNQQQQPCHGVFYKLLYFFLQRYTGRVGEANIFEKL